MLRIRWVLVFCCAKFHKDQLNFLRRKSQSWETTVWNSNNSNKTGIVFAPSRDLFYFGFFGVPVRFRVSVDVR